MSIKTVKRDVSRFVEMVAPDELALCPEYDGRTIVFECCCPDSGLHAFIAVDDKMKPSTGGFRIESYSSRKLALDDVVRLKVAMGYKSAAAGLPLGGGKAVKIGTDKSEECLEDMGAFVDFLGGRFVTGADAGTTTGDLHIVARQTRHVFGITERTMFDGSVRIGPAVPTAYGVYLGIEEAIWYRLGSPVLHRTVAISGLGAVGMPLARFCHKRKMKLIVADIDQEKTAYAAAEFGADVLSPHEIFHADADVFAPCVPGHGILNEETLTWIRAPIVAGATNNQLANRSAGRILRARRVLHAPDFVISAAGVMSIYGEICGWTPEEEKERIETIPDTLREIFFEADRLKESTDVVARRMAEAKLAVEASIAFPPASAPTAA